MPSKQQSEITRFGLPSQAVVTQRGCSAWWEGTDCGWIPATVLLTSPESATCAAHPFSLGTGILPHREKLDLRKGPWGPSAAICQALYDACRMSQREDSWPQQNTGTKARSRSDLRSLAEAVR